MEDRNDAPAFPVTAGNQVYATGLTLRDWFAAQATEADIMEHNPRTNAGSVPREVAKYRYADAMLEARK